MLRSKSFLNPSHVLMTGGIHRELKPGDIFVTKDARIKILDFGADADGVTPTSPHIEAGVVTGTASYIVPEQVRGEAADLPLGWQQQRHRRPFSISDPGG